MSSHRGRHRSTAGTSTPAAEHEQWRKQAACVSVDPELFFPPDGDKYGIKAAKQVCRRCAVRDECEAWTLDHPKLSQHGIWAGLTPRQRNERRRVAQRRSKAVANA